VLIARYASSCGTRRVARRDGFDRGLTTLCELSGILESVCSTFAMRYLRP
jgi:hypothetical protein